MPNRFRLLMRLGIGIVLGVASLVALMYLALFMWTLVYGDI